jgi:GAF domain-containing protein
VRPFTPDEVALVETFADQAVIAIENARLFQEIQAKNAELSEALEQQTATAEVLAVISSAPTALDEVLPALLARALPLIGAEAGYISRDLSHEEGIEHHLPHSTRHTLSAAACSRAAGPPTR